MVTVCVSSNLGLPDLASKNTGHPVKYKFQLNNKEFFCICRFHVIFGTYTKNSYLLFTWFFNLIGYPVFSVNPSWIIKEFKIQYTKCVFWKSHFYKLRLFWLSSMLSFISGIPSRTKDKMQWICFSIFFF